MTRDTSSRSRRWTTKQMQSIRALRWQRVQPACPITSFSRFQSLPCLPQTTTTRMRTTHRTGTARTRNCYYSRNRLSYTDPKRHQTLRLPAKRTRLTRSPAPRKRNASNRATTRQHLSLFLFPNLALPVPSLATGAEPFQRYSTPSFPAALQLPIPPGVRSEISFDKQENLDAP